MTTSKPTSELKLISGRPEKIEETLNALVRDGFRPILMTQAGDYGVCIMLERSSQ